MMMNRNRDFLFIFDAVNTNPNGDPDQENKPRMDNETRTLLVSDVRRKRDIRDFLHNKGKEIFVHTLGDTKVTMEKMFGEIMAKYGLKEKEATEGEKIAAILNNMVDIRMFGSAMAVGGITKTFTGPIQLTWGYSLHPVDLVKSNSIVTIMNDDNSTFGKMYKAYYALVAHGGSVNKFNAAKTGLTEEDLDLFRRALVQSMMNNLTHSKQGQQPLYYLEVVYAPEFDGYLGDLRRFLKVELKKSNAIRSQEDLTLDFAQLEEAIGEMKQKGYIDQVLLWKSPLAGDWANLPAGDELDLIAPIS